MKSVLLVLLLVSELLIAGCSQTFARVGAQVSEEDRGVTDLMIQYGCPACHTIPRVPGAVGQVGPALAGRAGGA